MALEVVTGSLGRERQVRCSGGHAQAMRGDFFGCSNIAGWQNLSESTALPFAPVFEIGRGARGDDPGTLSSMVFASA